MRVNALRPQGGTPIRGADAMTSTQTPDPYHSAMIASGAEIVPWKRVLFPADSLVPIHGDGFLEDPETPYPTVRVQPPIRPEDLNSAAALIAGESGIGKSYTLRAETQRLNDVGHRARFVDLVGLNAEDVGDAILEAVEEVGSDGTVLADGLDRTVGTVQSVARALLKVLQSYPDPLPRLRFSTVTGSPWLPPRTTSLAAPEGIDRALPAELRPCPVFRLAPLTEAQARQAAEIYVTAPDEFMVYVETNRLGALAAHPLSLRLMLQAHHNGRTPRTRREAYELGIAALVDGPGSNIPADASRPPTARILDAARHLATVTALSDTNVIRQRRRRADQPGEYVALDDVHTDDILLSELDAVLHSSLMIGTGQDHSWLHRSIEDCLCAETLRTLPKPSVHALLARPMAPEHLRPQLLGITTWLAAGEADWFDWVLKRRYELLFDADLAHLTDAQRRRLGTALIEHITNDDLPYTPGGDENSLTSWFSLDYRQLTYPELADDLAQLLDATQPAWRIREALLVMHANNIRSLDTHLMTLIEAIAHGAARDDYNAKIQAATSAAHALRECDDPAIASRGTAVLACADTPWTIRLGLARWLWPAHLTTRGLDEAIPPEQRTGQTGAFARSWAGVIERTEVPPEQDTDLLRFIATMPPRALDALRNLDQTRRLIMKVLRGEIADEDSWRHAVQLSAAFLRGHALPTWQTSNLQTLNDERRRRFVADLTTAASTSTVQYVIASGLTGRHDAHWWAHRMATAEDESDAISHRHAEAALATIAAEITDSTQMPAATPAEAAPLQNDRTATVFDRYFGAEACRDRAEQKPTPTLPVPHAVRLLDQLDELLTHDDERALDAIGDLGPANLNWNKVTEAQQTELTRHARRHAQSPQTSTATARNRQHLNAAHYILRKYDPDTLAAIPVSRWLDWLPSLLGQPDSLDPAHTAIARALAAEPDAAETILIPTLSDPTVVWLLQQRETAAISQAALDLVDDDQNIGGNHLYYLLAVGATHQPDRAANIAKSIISGQPDAGEHHARDRAVQAAVALAGMPHAHHHFTDLMAALQSDIGFANMVLRTAHHGGNRDTWLGLTPHQLGELFLWAHAVLPQPAYPAPGVYISGYSAADFTDRLLEILSHPENLTSDPQDLQRRTQAAVATLNHLAQHTGNVFIRQRARRLQDSTLTAGAATPISEILAVLKAPHLRSITTSQQFLQVLLAAIDSFADDILKDRAIRAQAWHRIRWNEKEKPGAWRPKDENELSTWIARELKHYLKVRIALLREVEINPRLGKTTADIPDIVALALKTGNLDIELDIVIEAKGNWHKEVMTAFKTQLADRYLAGPSSTTGIYLVWYFTGDAWDPEDWRKKKSESLTGSRTPRELQEFLQREADTVVAAGNTVHVRVIDAGLDAADAALVIGPDRVGT